MQQWGNRSSWYWYNIQIIRIRITTSALASMSVLTWTTSSCSRAAPATTQRIWGGTWRCWQRSTRRWVRTRTHWRLELSPGHIGHQQSWQRTRQPGPGHAARHEHPQQLQRHCQAGHGAQDQEGSVTEFDEEECQNLCQHQQTIMTTSSFRQLWQHLYSRSCQFL